MQKNKRRQEFICATEWFRSLRHFVIWFIKAFRDKNFPTQTINYLCGFFSIGSMADLCNKNSFEVLVCPNYPQKDLIADAPDRNELSSCQQFKDFWVWKNELWTRAYSNISAKIQSFAVILCQFIFWFFYQLWIGVREFFVDIRESREILVLNCFRKTYFGNKQRLGRMILDSRVASLNQPIALEIYDVINFFSLIILPAGKIT